MVLKNFYFKFTLTLFLIFLVNCSVKVRKKENMNQNSPQIQKQNASPSPTPSPDNEPNTDQNDNSGSAMNSQDPESQNDLLEPIINLQEDTMMKYKLQIQWPKKYGFFSIYINDQKIYSHHHLDIYQTHILLNSDTTYKIVFYQNEGPQSEQLPQFQSHNILYEKIIKTPVDIHLNAIENFEPLSRNHTLTANRVFITDEPITTKGFSLFVKTNQLISDKGFIQTFEAGAKAPVATPGRHGGSIQIIADIAVGELSLTTRGEHGGDGLAGSEIKERAKSGSDFYILPQGAPHGALRPGPCVPHIEKTESNGQKTYLSKSDIEIQNYLTGEKGRSGEPGGSGARGGDSGFVNLKIKKIDRTNPFHYNIIKEVGSGGNGGSGGLGQLQGIHGQLLKHPNFSSKCDTDAQNYLYHLSQKSYNERGPTGPNGATGDSGHYQNDNTQVPD